MGNKSNPKVMRLGISNEWDCSWYGDDQYANYVIGDFQIRNYYKREFQRAGLTRVVINRKQGTVDIFLHVARPGVIFGKNGMDMTMIKKESEKILNKSVTIKVLEVKNPEANAKLLADWVTGQLERRIPFRRVMKQLLQNFLRE